MKVEVVPPHPDWRKQFEQMAEQVAVALGENAVAIHHVGSTAIPSIYAKPILDLLVEVQNIDQVAPRNAAMAQLGYEAMGEFGIPQRRYFRRTTEAGIRTHHVHVFEVGSLEIRRHLAFRDYLIAHPAEAQQYSDLKRQLAAQHPDNIEAYMDGKDPFIKAVEQKAMAWYDSIQDLRKPETLA